MAEYFKLASGLKVALPLEWGDRIENYRWATKYPRSMFIGDDGRAVGYWILGNNYRVTSQFYGGYPATYLKRVKALFPEKKRVLHLFSGAVDLEIFPGDTVDINLSLAMKHPKSGVHYTDDAQTLERVPLEKYDLILADPPYSVEDAEHYKTTMIKRNNVMRALRRTKPGTHIVWLDQVLPIYRKDAFKIEALVGISRSTNHRFRTMVVFKRENNDL